MINLTDQHESHRPIWIDYAKETDDVFLDAMTFGPMGNASAFLISSPKNPLRASSLSRSSTPYARSQPRPFSVSSNSNSQTTTQTTRAVQSSGSPLALPLPPPPSQPGMENRNGSNAPTPINLPSQSSSSSAQTLTDVSSSQTGLGVNPNPIRVNPPQNGISFRPPSSSVSATSNFSSSMSSSTLIQRPSMSPPNARMTPTSQVSSSVPSSSPIPTAKRANSKNRVGFRPQGRPKESGRSFRPVSSPTLNSSSMSTSLHNSSSVLSRPLVSPLNASPTSHSVSSSSPSPPALGLISQNQVQMPVQERLPTTNQSFSSQPSFLAHPINSMSEQTLPVQATVLADSSNIFMSDLVNGRPLESLGSLGNTQYFTTPAPVARASTVSSPSEASKMAADHLSLVFQKKRKRTNT